MNKSELVVFLHVYGDRELSRIPARWKVPQNEYDMWRATALMSYRAREGHPLAPIWERVLREVYGTRDVTIGLDYSRSITGLTTNYPRVISRASSN